MFSCTNPNSRNDETIKEKEMLVDTVYFGSYHYVTNIEELGETHLYFTFSDVGMEGKAFSKDKNQEFRIEPVMHLGGYANLKLVKKETLTNDLDFYDYRFHFEYRYMSESSIKTSFYSKDTDIRTDVLISKIEQE